MDLTNRVALVTGGGRGIGQAIVMRLAAAGAGVIINDIDQASAESVAAQVQATGRPSLAVVADVSDAASVAKMMETALAALGRIDILVNNAGITRDRIILRMTDEDWDKVLDINLKSAFLCTRAVLPGMLKQRWGRVISLSSVVGICGNPGQVNYASSKAGIIGLTRAIAREVASRGITANALAPGFIDTEMTQKIGESVREEVKKRIPLGYLGSPQDVAEAVAFFASPEACYITGQVLSVDGGMAGAWW
ncbi:MAG: 3-oxoacyl-[acyl-carrier-protein] reductase [Chloroflexi bacterium]|nr:3-oxoacyl-[acyl-carrier-protein] reductase [Chloroflexota bacterium]